MMQKMIAYYSSENEVIIAGQGVKSYSRILGSETRVCFLGKTVWMFFEIE